MNQAELNPQQPQAPQPYYYQMPPAEDEIDLFELWGVLIKKRVLIFSIAIISALLATTYAFVVPSVYKTTISLLPPNLINIQGMNVQKININTSIMTADSKNSSICNLINFYTSHCVFEKFITNFESKRLQSTFNTKNGSSSIFTITRPKKRATNPTVTASLESHDSASVAQLLNSYAHHINNLTIQQIVDEIQQNQQQQITRFDEAITLARKLDIKRPQNYALPEGTPLEFYGYQYLEAKKASLENQQNNTVSGSNNFTTVKFDTEVTIPSHPIKPRKNLIIILGIVLGLMLGVFAAFLHHAIQSHREKLTASPN